MRMENEKGYNLIKEKGLTIKEIARLIGKKPMSVYGVFNGYNTCNKTQKEIAKLLGKPVDYIFGD